MPWGFNDYAIQFDADVFKLYRAINEYVSGAMLVGGKGMRPALVEFALEPEQKGYPSVDVTRPLGVNMLPLQKVLRTHFGYHHYNMGVFRDQSGHHPGMVIVVVCED